MKRKKKDQAKPVDAQKPSKSNGRFSYAGLDRVMHEKARLGILASLAAHERGLLFNDLKQLCALTDGNLSRHLGVLSDAGLVEIWKGTTGPRSQTMVRLTVAGRERFTDYLGVLEQVIADAHAEKQAAAKQQGLSGDWVPA